LQLQFVPKLKGTNKQVMTMSKVVAEARHQHYIAANLSRSISDYPAERLIESPPGMAWHGFPRTDDPGRPMHHMHASVSHEHASERVVAQTRAEQQYQQRRAAGVRLRKPTNGNCRLTSYS
jgi:hypothetical protein